MTINRIVFRNIVGLLVFLFLGINNFGYAKEVKINKYMDNDVYFKMPESDFVKMFTRTDSWSNHEKPYIIKKIKNYYLLKDPSTGKFGITQGGKFKVTFKNNQLVKLEISGWYGLPIFRDLLDATHQLKLYEIEDGLYVGMPKNEFLIRFVDRIVGKVSEDYYAIEAKGGGYRTVSFEDDLLIHAPIIGPEDWKGWQKYLVK